MSRLFTVQHHNLKLIFLKGWIQVIQYQTRCFHSNTILFIILLNIGKQTLASNWPQCALSLYCSLILFLIVLIGLLNRDSVHLETLLLPAKKLTLPFTSFFPSSFSLSLLLLVCNMCLSFSSFSSLFFLYFFSLCLPSQTPVSFFLLWLSLFISSIFFPLCCLLLHLLSFPFPFHLQCAMHPEKLFGKKSWDPVINCRTPWFLSSCWQWDVVMNISALITSSGDRRGKGKHTSLSPPEVLASG